MQIEIQITLQIKIFQYKYKSKNENIELYKYQKYIDKKIIYIYTHKSIQIYMQLLRRYLDMSEEVAQEQWDAVLAKRKTVKK